VTYKGDPPMLADVAGGHLELSFTTVLSAAPLIKSGKIRAIAVTGAERSQVLPDVPTVQEAGMPGYVTDAWLGMSVPAGTPAAIVTRLNAALQEVLQDSTVRESLYLRGMAPAPSSVEAYAEFLKEENARWTRIIREAKISNE